MVRWKIIIPIAFVVLIAAGALAIHLILQSELVGEVVLARASERLGMEVTAESFHAAWDGQTVIRGLAVTMPLTDERVVSAETVRLSHAAVPWLVLGRPFHLRSVEVESPRVNVRRYESGRWNVQEVLARLRAAGRERAWIRGTALPQVAVHDGRIHVAGPNEAGQMLGPVEFQASPRGQLLWTFDLKLPAMAEVEGRLLQGGDWAHEAGFAVEGIGPLVQQFSRSAVSPIAVSGRWQGRIVGSTLNGTIQLTDTEIGPMALRGEIRVEADRNAVTLKPGRLLLGDPNLENEALLLTAGAIRITREVVTVEQLAAKRGDLAAWLDGRYDLDSRAGEFSGSWTAGVGGQAQYRGVCKGAVHSPRLGRVELDATLNAQARTTVGIWTMAANVQGAGLDWQQSEWRISVPQVTWSRNDTKAEVTQATAQIDVNWPVIRLTSMQIPNARTTSSGAEFNAETHRWSVYLEANALHSGITGLDDIDFRLSARGDHREALISELRLAAGARVIEARGELSLAGRVLRNVSISADWPAAPAEPGEPQSVYPAERWSLKAGMSGRIQPPAMVVEGDLTGRNVPIGRQIVSQVTIPIRANIDDGQIQVTTDSFELLSGRWQLTGRHELADGLTQVNMVVDGLSLKAAAGIAGSPFASEGTAQAQLQLTVPGVQIEQAVATGKWTAENVRIPPLEAEKARGRIRIGGGLAKFEDIELEQGNGRTHAEMEFRLNRPQDLIVEFTAESWPVRFEEYPLAILADSQANLHVDVIRGMVEGQMHVSGRVWLRDRDLARVHVDTLVDGRTLDVHDLYVETLGGSVEGSARIVLDRWGDSTADLQWQEIQLRSLEQWWPQFHKCVGDVSGRLVVEQTSERSRPLGPMRFTVEAHAAGGRYGPAEIRGCHVVGYLDEHRLVINDGTVRAFGGQINARGRVSRHAAAYHASVITDFNSLDLDQLVHIIDPNAREHIGLVTGRISLLSSLDQRTLSGDGDIRLTRSDLVNNAAIAVLHSALNLNIGGREPKGTGRVQVRLEGSSLTIPSFEYFNRGIEIRGAGRIYDVYAGDESPVEGYAIGSTRVLKGSSLPGVRSLDRLMASLQTGVAAVKISGTLEKAEVKTVPLPSISGDLRRLLWAQLRQ